MAIPIQPTMYELVDTWLAKHVAGLKTQLRKRNIGVTQKLAASFVRNVIADSEGNVERARLMFNYYGRFVDMGVGRGQKVGQVKELNSVQSRVQGLHSVRKPKKWFSKPMAAGVHELTELLAKYFGNAALQIIESPLLDAKIEVTI